MNFRDDAAAIGKLNMQRDCDLLFSAEQEAGSGFFRTYTWTQPTLTYGYSQAIDSILLKTDYMGYDRVQRPTGGGIVVHQPGEWTYALALSRTFLGCPLGMMSSFLWITQHFLRAFEQQGVFLQFGKLSTKDLYERRSETRCFVYPAKYELTHQGKKVLGAAQKRTREGLLQQGTIQGLVFDSAQLISALQHEFQVKT